MLQGARAEKHDVRCRLATAASARFYMQGSSSEAMNGGLEVVGDATGSGELQRRCSAAFEATAFVRCSTTLLPQCETL